MANKRVLEVSIVGDAASLKRALGTAGAETETFAKRTDAAHAKIKGHFAGMATSAVKAGAGFVAAYASISGAKNAMSATEALAKTTLLLSKNFGLTTKTASEWAAVAQSRGVDGNKLTMGFKGLSTAIRGAETGSKAQTAAFKELGISQQTLSKHGNDLNFMLKAVSDGLVKMPAGTERSALQAKLFGRTWQTLSPLLRDGSKALGEQLGMADKLGATFSNKGAKGVSDMIAQQREAKLATLGLQVAFGTQLAPALTSVIEKVTATIGFFRQHHDAAAVLKPAIIGVAGALTIAKVAQIGLNLAVLSNPYVAAAAAVAALTAATIVAYHSSATFRSVVDGAYHGIQSAVGASTAAVRGFLANHRADIHATEQVVHNIGETIRFVWDHVAMPVVQRVLPAIVQVVRGAFNVIHGLVEILTGVLTGDFGRAWTGVEHIFSGGANAIVGTVRAVTAPMRLAVATVVGAAESAAEAGWSAIKGGASAFGGALRGVIVGAFKGAANDVVGFINDIIDVVNVIPGVPNIGHVKGFAKGGVIEARAQGGIVTAPTVIMGEDAPRHPEYVIPTNPAYRSRAHMLMGQAANAIGLASGGVIGAFKRAIDETGAGPKASLALFEAGVVESNLENLPGGDRDSRGALQVRDSTAGPMGLNNRDPFAVAMAFLTRGFYGQGGAIDIAKAHRGWTAGNVAQATQGSEFPARYDAVRSTALSAMRGGGGILKAVGGIVGDLLDGGADFLLGKLPDTGKLPGWIKGLGSFVLGKVTSWIRDKVEDVLSDVTGAISGAVSGLLGDKGGNTGTDGHPGNISKALLPYIALAHRDGLQVTATTDGTHVAGSNHYSGNAVDVSNGTNTPQEMTFARQMLGFAPQLRELFYDPLGKYVKNGQIISGAIGGHSDHVHFAAAQGGWAGPGIVRVGELGAEDVYFPGRGHVTQASQSTDHGGRMRINLTENGDVHLASPRAAEIAMNKLAFRLTH